jgi:DUF4097 and DUF4098 domain-containing protein YvlB
MPFSLMSNHGRHRRLAQSGVVCLAVVLLAATAFAREPVDARVKATVDGMVSIENLAGSVHVIGWDQDEVRVEGHLADVVKRLDLDSEEGEVTIEVVLPRRVDDVGETDLEIHVPKGSSLDIETVSAWIRIEGVHGNLMAESVSGSITCEGSAESVEFETVSGGIEITGVKSRIEAESVSGAVEIRDAGGAVEAATVSGSVTISGGDFERGDFESVSGALHFEGDLESDGHYQFENLSGSTTLVLPEDADATFTIETFSGSIKSDFDARIDSEDHGPGKFSEFSRGSGAATLEITSFSGSITLKMK